LIGGSRRSILSRVVVRRLIGNLVRNRAFQLLPARYRGKEYLNLGCGGNILRNYINLDYGWVRGIDLCWDIRKGIPLPSNSMRGIFTEHTLEHFTWRDAIRVFLPECFRILREGGVLRITVPDAELCLRTYEEARARGETGTSFRAPYDGGDRIPLTPMMHVNNTFRRIYEPLEVGHKFVYDFQTLEYFLHCVGFVDVTKESFRRGRDPMLLADYQKRAAETLYVEAVKPRAAR
jgi:predicted SAM-dependent methyltransferase